MVEGFVYALINPSMKGIVKVGKTTKDPETRAEELSNSTGVAVPFIVTYQEYFRNCDAAEKFVHEILESRGYRLNRSREFFEAPLPEVVKAISLALSQDVEDYDDTAPDIETGGRAREYNPGIEIFDEAMAHYNGEGDYFEDHEEALRLFKRAAKLGVARANYHAGMICAHGSASRKDTHAAIKHYREGLSKGDWLCSAPLALEYFTQLDAENGAKATAIFFEALSHDTSWLSSQDNFTEFNEVVNQIWALIQARDLMIENSVSCNVEVMDAAFECVHLVKRRFLQILKDHSRFFKERGDQQAPSIVEQRNLELMTAVMASAPSPGSFSTLRYMYFARHVNRIVDVCAQHRKKEPAHTLVKMNIGEILDPDDIRHILEEEELVASTFMIEVEDEWGELSDNELSFPDYDAGNLILKVSPNPRKDLYQILALRNSFGNFCALLWALGEHKEELLVAIRGTRKKLFGASIDERRRAAAVDVIRRAGVVIAEDDVADAGVLLVAQM